MPDTRRFELDELVNRPGTYFNPETEIVLVVDDSAHVDSEVVGTDEAEEAEWVLISDEVPVDEHRRDELLERFQIRHEGRATGVGSLDEDDDLEDEDEEEGLSELEEE